MGVPNLKFCRRSSFHQRILVIGAADDHHPKGGECFPKGTSSIQAETTSKRPPANISCPVPIS